MALVKLLPGEFLRSGKHAGSCVQESGQGLSLKNNNHGRRWRSPIQLSAKSFTFYAVKKWRELDNSVRTLWVNWATTYPQPTILNPFAYLTGYELFVKRNYYLYLSSPTSFSWMIDPNFIAYDSETIITTIMADTEKIEIKCEFSLSSGNWDCLIFVSNSQSPGLNFGNTRWRFMASVRSTSQTIDITANYLFHFGLLPPVDSDLFVSIVFCGKDNGQFTFHQLIKLTVQIPEPPMPIVNFGTLYNLYSIIDTRGFARSPFRVADAYDYINLVNAVGGSLIAGGKIKETGFVHWQSPNVGATNDSGFTSRCLGSRNPTSGAFQFQLLENNIWTSSIINASNYYVFRHTYNSAAISFNANSLKYGNPVRVCTSDLSQSTYIGNDGQVYQLVQIGSLKWCIDNSIESHFGNGDEIPVVESSSSWINLNSAGRCYYNNDISNSHS